MYSTMHTMTPAPVMTGPDSSSALVTRILETHTARILYAAPVEPIAMQRCVELIDESFSYYQYDQVEIEIESNGGRVDSMHSMRARIDRWRRDGRKIHTRALVTCASAAASLLSMGEIGGRTVSPSTTLLYHFSRVHTSSAAITSERARDLTRRLDREDERMLEQLLDHVMGTDETAAAAWLQCALARIEWAKEFIRHGNSQRAFVRKDAAERLRRLERTLKAIRSESSIRARVRTHLEAMFALDQAADLLEAWALNLFDRIEDVTP